MTWFCAKPPEDTPAEYSVWPSPGTAVAFSCQSQLLKVCRHYTMAIRKCFVKTLGSRPVQPTMRQEEPSRLSSHSARRRCFWRGTPTTFYWLPLLFWVQENGCHFHPRCAHVDFAITFQPSSIFKHFLGYIEHIHQEINRDQFLILARYHAQNRKRDYLEPYTKQHIAWLKLR